MYIVLVPSKFYVRNFVPGYYYHIFNRGSRKQEIFLDKSDYQTFQDILTYYLKFPTGKPISKLPNKKVRNLPEKESSFKIAAFCLMPNHFHLLLKQYIKPTSENSIINFMRRTSITYSMFFKDKYDLSGSIFEGKYKNVLVDTDKQLVYLTKYIHLNPSEVLKPGQLLKNYPYSSYPRYIGKSGIKWLYSNEVLRFFSQDNPRLTYNAFVEEKPDIPDSISHLLLE